MYQFDTASIPVLQEDTKAAIAAADDALLTNAVLLTTILQTAKTADLPISVTQDLYGNMVEGSVKLLEGREQLRKSIGMMHSIARQHPESPKMAGCPVPPMAKSPAIPVKRKSRETV
jgi:hypothetical protein